MASKRDDVGWYYFILISKEPLFEDDKVMLLFWHRKTFLNNQTGYENDAFVFCFHIKHSRAYHLFQFTWHCIYFKNDRNCGAVTECIHVYASALYEQEY